jgi:radical SAM-linked protein
MGCKGGGSLRFGTAPASGRSPKPAGAPTRRASGAGIASRIRMRYTKTGRMRFLSHLDFMALVHRSAVRAGVPIAFSQGFNPHPKISFGPALSVGIESDAEYFDMETDALVDLPDLAAGLNAIMPQGIRFVEARLVPRSAPSLSGSVSRYVYECLVPAEHAAGLADRVQQFLGLREVVIAREKGTRDIRPCIVSVEIQGEAKERTLAITLEDRDQLKPRIQDVVARCFGLEPEQAYQFMIRRKAVYCRLRDVWVSPLEV